VKLSLTAILLLAPALFAARDRITQPIDRLRTAPLQGHLHPSARPEFDDGALPADTPLDRVTIFFKPAPGIESFLSELQLPGTPNYHRFLTPEQFGDRFGLSDRDLTQIRAWLQASGLQIEQTARGRHWISFSGTAAQVSDALHTDFRRFQVNGRMQYATRAEPKLPAAIAAIASGIRGLDDFPLLNQPRIEPLASRADGSHFLVPDDFATIYNIAPLYAAGIDGTGVGIAIIGGSTISLADYRNFRRTYNLANNDPEQILVGGSPGSTSAVFEANLDLQWAGAVARNARLTYVYGRDFFVTTAYAIDQNLAPIVSLSAGGCELYNADTLRGAAQQANAQGITFIASSGDAGAAECDRFSGTPQASKGPTIGYPANLPEVTAVGGTTFDEAGSRYWANTNNANGASAIGYIPERAWNDSIERNDLSSAGGGASAIYAKPWWQNGPGVPDDKGPRHPRYRDDRLRLA